MAKKLKVVTIGGGSSYTPELMEGFLKRYDEFPISELWLVDVKEGEEKQNIICELLRRMVKKQNLDIKIHQTLNRREALKDADFVTTQFRVGQLEARHKDEAISLKNGVLGQETNGSGGLFKGLRTIPIILDIVREVEELAPNAWIINFANPAGMVTEAVFKYTKFKKFLGVCNVPIGMKKSALELINKEDEKSEDVTMDLFGLNHMVFMSDFKIKNESYFDQVIKKIVNHEGTVTVKNIVDLDYNSNLIEGLNLIPCPYHRYYFKEKEMLTIEMAEFYKGETRAEVVMKLEKELFELYKDENLDIKPPQLELRGGAYYSDAACEVISSIYNDKQQELYVNFQNNGHIKNIGHDWAIEMSAIVGKDGAKPVSTVTEFDPKVIGLITSIKNFEQLAARAAVTGNYNDGILAMNMNPLIHSDSEAKKIFDELLEAHKEHLPNFFNKK